LADGTNLGKSINISSLKQNYLKLKYIDIHYFANVNVWTNKGYWDNKLLNPTANTRYDLIAPYTRLDLVQHEAYNFSNQFAFYIDGHVTNLFPAVNDIPIQEHFEINAYLDNILQDTLDFQINCKLLTDYENNTYVNPNVKVSMLIEKLGNKKQDAIQF